MPQGAGEEGYGAVGMQWEYWGIVGMWEYRDTGIQRCGNTGIQGYRDVGMGGMQGCRNTGIQGRQGYRDTGIQGMWRYRECKDAGIQKM